MTSIMHHQDQTVSARFHLRFTGTVSGCKETIIPRYDWDLPTILKLFAALPLPLDTSCYMVLNFLDVGSDGLFRRSGSRTSSRCSTQRLARQSPHGCDPFLTAHPYRAGSPHPDTRVRAVQETWTTVATLFASSHAMPCRGMSFHATHGYGTWCWDSMSCLDLSCHGTSTFGFLPSHFTPVIMCQETPLRAMTCFATPRFVLPCVLETLSFDDGVR